jgi:hypothetical protein
MDAAGQRPPPDDTPSSTPTEPLNKRLANNLSVYSWRDSTKHSNDINVSDFRRHTPTVTFSSSGATILGFYCGADERGRYAEVHITSGAVVCLNEHTDSERAADIRRQAEARQRNIRRIMDTLKAVGSPLCDIAESMLQGYDRAASEEEAS